MLTLAETPQALLANMSVSLAEIRDPRARHWLILPGRGRAEKILQMWANRSGIAAHTQEVELRVLIEQAASGEQRKRFDFDRLRMACASILPNFSDLPDFPIHTEDPLTPIDASVLTWATSIAKAIDDGLQCRSAGDCWEPGSFLAKICAHPAIADALQSHIGGLDSTSFAQSTRSWIHNWANRGGVPHLWIQLDSGIPTVQFERLQQFLQILAEQYRSHIHLFALAPSREYWGDSPIRARKSEATDDPDLHPGALLWALGQASQDLHQQLSETFLAFGDGGLWLDSPPPGPSLLGQLQHACRFSKPIPVENRAVIAPDDTSLTVHSARSTLRELEVCRDRILQARLELPDLRNEEILLLLTDPKRQAPYIQAALRSDDPKHPSIPFRMLGFGQTVPSPLTESLTLLLQKLRGRLDLEDLQALIENPLIAAKFGFDEASQDRIDVIAWLRESQFRWGLEAAHRGEFQKIPEGRWNLFWAIQRLGLGAIVAPEQRNQLLTLSETGTDTVPLERASGLSLRTLARLAQFATALQTARALWTENAPHTVPVWNERLTLLAETFLDCSSGSATQHHTKLFTSILPQLARAVEDLEILLQSDAYIRTVTEKLESVSEAGTRGAGGICIADLRQYSGVPARLTLIAGLDDGVFPRRDERPEWHPLSRSRKPGDPSLREVDRHALLLAILACQERLVLSYQGGSDEDAKHRPPSTALADLLNAVEENCATPGFKINLEFRHPLNGFSPAAFCSALPATARNHLTLDFPAARQLESRSALTPFPGLWSQQLPPPNLPGPRKLSLASLRHLLHEPGRLLLHRLGIRLPEEQPELEGGDLLDPGTIHRWILRDTALTATIEGKDLALIRRRLEAAGEIPRAQIGERFWNRVLSEVPSSLPPINPQNKLSGLYRVNLSTPDGQGSLTIEGGLRSGWYALPEEQKAVFISPSSFSYKQDLALTLDLLILAANPNHGEAGTLLTGVDAYFHSASKPRALSLPSPDKAVALLQRLVPLFDLAQQIALPFWPDPAEAALKATLLRKEPIPHPTSLEIKSALDEAYGKWASSSDKAGPGPSNLPATRTLFRGCVNPMIWSPDVTQIAPWLPHSEDPLAWRILTFVHEWKTAATGN